MFKNNTSLSSHLMEINDLFWKEMENQQTSSWWLKRYLMALLLVVSARWKILVILVYLGCSHQKDEYK